MHAPPIHHVRVAPARDHRVRRRARSLATCALLAGALGCQHVNEAVVRVADPDYEVNHDVDARLAEPGAGPIPELPPGHTYRRAITERDPLRCRPIAGDRPCTVVHVVELDDSEDVLPARYIEAYYVLDAERDEWQLARILARRPGEARQIWFNPEPLPPRLEDTLTPEEAIELRRTERSLGPKP